MNQSQVICLKYCFAFILGFLFSFYLIFDSKAQQIQNPSQKSKTSSDIIISEICQIGNSNLNFIELYNPTEQDIDLASGNYYLSRDNISSISNVALTGIISAKGTYVCSVPYSWFIILWKWFYWEYEIDPHQQNSNWSINSATSFMIYKGGDSSSGILIDIYGEQGFNYDNQEWDYSNAHAVRKRHVTTPSPVWDKNEWVIIQGGTDQMTPGQHAVELTYLLSSGSWNSRGNWDGMGYVPDASVNVLISSDCNISITASSACHQVLIESGAILSLSANMDLQVVDEIINEGGTEAFILNSDISGNSSLIHYSDSCQATVYSYFPEINYWYLVASPIKDALAGVFFNQYLDYWDEPAETWQSIEDENYSLQVGSGYSVKKAINNTACYQGNLNNGIINIDSLRYTAANSPELRGWNLIGNPYPSVLDFNQVDVSGKQINAGISVWPHDGTESASYITWSQGGGIPVGNDEARYIQPGQGFMIQVAADMESFELTNDCRTHLGLGNIDKNNNAKSNQEKTLSFELNGIYDAKDYAYFAVREGSTDDFDLGYDVRKMFGSAINPHVYFFGSESDNEKLAISCVGQPESNDYYFVGIKGGLEGEYTLKVKGISTFDNQPIWLIDEVSQDIYDLKTDSIIQFYWQNGQANKRFKLVFDEQVSINNLSLKTLEILTYVRGSRLYFSGTDLKSNKTHVQIYNFLGQKVKDESLLHIDDGIELNLSSGYYWAYLLSGDKNYRTKFFMP